MPAFLEKKLKKEYPHNSHAVYGTMNKLGVMRGNKETAKGRYQERKHELDKRLNKAKGYNEGHRGPGHHRALELMK